MLGDRIALLRRSLGLSQAELARKLHISPSAVGMYEQGRREPSLEALVALARELQVTADYLLTGNPATQEDTRALRRVLERTDRGNRRGGFSKEELQVLIAAVMSEA